MNKKELKELIATIWLGAMFASGVRHLGHELINQDRFSGFPKQINTTQITKEAEEDLTAEQYAILQDKIKEIYANLGIENMQDKSAEEQKRAAYKILRHVINTTTYLNSDKTNSGVNVNNREKDSVYQTICQNLNIDFINSESMAYSLLLSVCGALMLLTGKWNTKGVHTVEEFDPDPFMAELNVQGLPWQETFDPVKVD